MKVRSLMNFLRHLVLSSALLVGACAGTTTSRHQLSEIELTIAYSTDWVEVSKQRLTKAYEADSSPDKRQLPGGDFSQVIFAIANRSFSGRTPIITVAIIPNSEGACPLAAEPGLARELAALESKRFPGASFDFRKFSELKLSSDFEGYLMKINLQNREVDQYHVFYCHGNDFVRIEGTSSSEAAGREVELVLSSLAKD
ncbi:MAG: hypothetical protein QM719_10750 [Thermomonas sp.]